MYLAEYDIGGVPWVQTAGALTYPRHAGRDAIDRWWGRFRTLVRSLDAAGQIPMALRVSLRTEMHATLFASAPAAHASTLRRALGSFTQLEVVADGAVEYARTRSEHDRLLHFPRYQCRVVLPPFATASAWFAFDFRVHDHLDELLWEARALGYEIAYHVNLEPLAMDADWLRRAARNALYVADSAGVPPRLVSLQRDLASRLQDATHVCEEFLGVETPDAREWLRVALTRRFRDTYGRAIPAEFTIDEGGHEESLAATRHVAAFETLAVDEVCGAAVLVDAGLDLVTWRPAPDLIKLMPFHAVTEDEHPARHREDYSEMPLPYGGTDGYAFISYKREDIHRIKALAAELGRRGHRIWYDQGIPGGAEWDALIEERIQNCSVLLLFLSQAAVESKYVRREVKFADTLNKSIVGIRLHADIDLSRGLAMLLNQYQVIDAAPGQLVDEIDRAMRFNEVR